MTSSEILLIRTLAFETIEIYQLQFVVWLVLITGNSKTTAYRKKFQKLLDTVNGQRTVQFYNSLVHTFVYCCPATDICTSTSQNR